METFMQEVEIMKKLDHPNVLKLYEYFIEDDDVYLVTEICKGGELFDRIVEKEFYPEPEAAQIFEQILRAVNYIHSQGIAHRDIKPENFLFESKEEDATLKIIDFGLSKILQKGPKPSQPTNSGAAKKNKLADLGKMNTKAGTPCYISPEVLTGNYGAECDMWSCGCMLYILLAGYPPFEGDDDYELCQSILKGKVEFDGEEWEGVSKDAKQLIMSLICKPEKRLSADEALQHKWMKKNCKRKSAIGFTGQFLKQFTNFQGSTGLQQAAMTAISVQVSPDEIKELKDLFISLDVNGDGSLSLEEIKEGLKGQANEQQILNMLMAADTDGSGDINYTEFIAACIGSNIYENEKYLKQAFDMFDKDKSGKIDKDEVVALLSGEEMSGIVPQSAIVDAIKEID
jgi:calcium-dependent protein kinase